MKRFFFHSKIHRARVTGTNLHYEGSLTVDVDLLERANIQPFEQIQVLNISNAERFVTYAIAGPRGSGAIEVNGAASRMCQIGDLLIVISYCELSSEEIEGFQPKVVKVDDRNKYTESIGPA